MVLLSRRLGCEWCPRYRLNLRVAVVLRMRVAVAVAVVLFLRVLLFLCRQQVFVWVAMA